MFRCIPTSLMALASSVAVTPIASAGTPTLQMIATSPTSFIAGGILDLQLDFSMLQESTISDWTNGEPTPEVANQTWIAAGHLAYAERLTRLVMTVGIGPGMEQ